MKYVKPNRPKYFSREFREYLAVRALNGADSYCLEDGTNAQSRRSTAADIAEELDDAMEILFQGLIWKNVSLWMFPVVLVFVVFLHATRVANCLMAVFMPSVWSEDSEN